MNVLRTRIGTLEFVHVVFAGSDATTPLDMPAVSFGVAFWKCDGKAHNERGFEDGYFKAGAKVRLKRSLCPAADAHGPRQSDARKQQRSLTGLREDEALQQLLLLSK